MPLTEQAQAFLDAIAEANPPGWHEMSPPEAREVFDGFGEVASVSRGHCGLGRVTDTPNDPRNGPSRIEEPRPEPGRGAQFTRRRSWRADSAHS